MGYHGGAALYDGLGSRPVWVLGLLISGSGLKDHDTHTSENYLYIKKILFLIFYF